MITLANRLLAVSTLVREGSRLADVGTDHAHLPIFLLQQGKVTSCIATDINKGPLENALGEVTHHGVTGVDLRLGNGLAPIKKGEVTDIVIAGMGGENIAAIIDSCPWAKSEELNFVLQPMTRAEELRSYLCKTGFTIYSEVCATEGGKHYCVIGARYTGTPVECDSVFGLIGTLGTNTDKASFDYISYQLAKQKVIFAEVSKSITTSSKAVELQDTITKLEGVLNAYCKRDF